MPMRCDNRQRGRTPSAAPLRRLAVALGLAVALTGASEASAQVRLLPLGDSITHGGQGHASYRYRLWEMLAQAGRHFTFVGTQQTIFGGDPPVLAWYPDYLTTFDRDHEGHWGWRTDQIDDVATAVAQATQPDIVLVHLGTNDIGQQGAAGVVNAEHNLRTLIGLLRAERPAVTILLAQVIPIGPGTSYSANAGQVASLNAAIAAIAADSTRPASPILLVDQHTGFDLGTMMQSDGLHPDTLGEAHMASRWRDVLLPLLPADPGGGPAVPDSSFEEPALADGALASGPGVVGGWLFTGTAATFAGIFDPPAGSYPDAGGAGTPAGAHGQNVAFLFNDGGPSEQVSLSRVLPDTLVASSEYTLRVAIGRFLPDQPYAFSTYGGYRIELLAGGQVIASGENVALPAVGAFADAEVSVRSDAPPALAQVGQPLSLRFTLGTDQAPRSTHFDHVRLERRPLPTHVSSPRTRFSARVDPHPMRAMARLHLSLPAAAEVRLSLCDLAGRRISEPWRGSLGDGAHVLPLAAPHAPGLYWLRIEAGSETHTLRLVQLGD